MNGYEVLAVVSFNVLRFLSLTFASLVVYTQDSGYPRSNVTTLSNIPLAQPYLLHKEIHDPRNIYLANVVFQ